MMLLLALAAFFTMPKSSNSRIPLTIVQDDLPELYQHCYEHVEPVSMGSAALKYDKTAEVAWGGPPHKGSFSHPAQKKKSRHAVEHPW